MKTPKTLSVRAKDNHGQTYPVTIQESSQGPLILTFGTAPGGWSLGSLRDYREEQLAFDFGQGWYCINIQEVLAEAFKAI